MAICAQCAKADAVLAGVCRSCWGRQLAAGRVRYEWTPAMDEQLREVYRTGSRRELSEGLGRLERMWRRPRKKINVRAMQLGITLCKRVRWTAEERALLDEMRGKYPTTRIAARIGKSVLAVKAFCRREGSSLKVREGYTAADLAWCFGEEEHKIARWWRRGLFGVQAQRGQVRRVTEAMVRRFIREHHGEYDLRRVQPSWFVSMCFSGKVGSSCQD